MASYGERNTSGTFINFIQHRSKIYLLEISRLKVDATIFDVACLKAFISPNITNLFTSSRKNKRRCSWKVYNGVIGVPRHILDGACLHQDFFLLEGGRVSTNSVEDRRHIEQGCGGGTAVLFL
jgi:hypothetical protein